MLSNSGPKPFIISLIFHFNICRICGDDISFVLDTDNFFLLFSLLGWIKSFFKINLGHYLLPFFVVVVVSYNFCYLLLSAL